MPTYGPRATPPSSPEPFPSSPPACTRISRLNCARECPGKLKTSAKHTTPVKRIRRIVADHRPSTIDHRPSTIHHRPSTIDHRPSTIDHRPSTVGRDWE